MKRAPRFEGRIPVDLHSHPSGTKSDAATFAMLASPGVAGLACIVKDGTNPLIPKGGVERILTYEKVVARFPVHEIESGMFAKIGDGYVARTQELVDDIFHILSVGTPGPYLPETADARWTVEEIHRRGGVAVLNHPYMTANPGKFVRYRFITEKEEERARQLCEMVDEVEIFNAQCINPTLGIVVPDFRRANDLAEKLAQEHGFRGLVHTDAHYHLAQPKICGTDMDEDGISMERIKCDIISGDFANDRKAYVSRWSFVMGMFLK